jgi:hypothetical protein
MSVLTEPVTVHDGMLYETDQRYTRREFTFRNNTGGTLTFEVFTPCLTSSTKKVPAPDDDADSLLLKRLVSVADSTDVLHVPFLVKGPAIVNQDVMSFIAAADSGNKTAQKADLEALGIRLISEPVTQEHGAGD